MTICMISSPEVCKELKFNPIGNVTPFQCFHYGQVEAAKHVPNGWRVTKMTCGRVTQDI